jgi:hypothetical protein
MASKHGIERAANDAALAVATVPTIRRGEIGTFGGKLSVNALGVGAVPATARVYNGIATDIDGRLCTTTSPTGVTVKGGIGHRADGALLTTLNAPGATSRMVHTPFGSFLADATGAIHTA